MTDFLAANWVWIVLVVALLAMHRGGGCGSHGSHTSHSQPDPAARSGRADDEAHR